MIQTEGPGFLGTWSQVSGPNTAVIDDVNALNTVYLALFLVSIYLDGP